MRTHYRFSAHPALAVLLLVFLMAGGRAPAGPAGSPPSVSVIRVLVLYTPQAAAGAGGTPAMLSEINEAAVEANTVFQNSRVNARIYLAKVAMIPFRESGSVSNDLARLQGTNDAVLKQAHTLRDETAADLVCLITETGNDYDFYGLQGPSSENAFSILRQPYLTGLNYFPVTLSFNFGCQLEQGYTDSAGAFPYAYGYTFYVETNETEYSTVEAFNGERRPFFSNPDIQFGGQATGVPQGMPGAADNALVLNQTAPIVAAFRGTAVTTQPPVISLTYPTDGDIFWSGTNLPLTVATYDPDGTVASVDYYLDTTNLIASTSGGFLNGVWHNPAIGVHTLMAVAMDNQRASTVSAPISVTILPVNDYFASRSPISLPAVIQEPNDLATAETNEPDNNGNPPEHSLWWTWTAPADDYVAISVTSNSIPLNISVYTGTSLATLSNVTADAYEPASPSALLLRAVTGASYQITADSQGGGTGNVAFNVSKAPAPPNDDFVHRIPLKGSTITVNADNTYATSEPGEPYQIGDTESSGNASLWWTWTAPASGQVTFTAASDSGEPLLAGVYTGDSITNLTLVADETSFAPGSAFAFGVQAGTSYQIVIDDDLVYGYSPGPFSFALDFIAPSANQYFNNRTRISGSWISLTNALVGGYGDPYFESGLNALWWSWTAPANGWVTLSTGTYDWLDAFTGSSLTNLTEVPLNDFGAFDATRGTTYTIAGTGDSVEFPMSLVLSTVQIASPATGATAYLGKTLALTASTTANDGKISQVQYFANGTLVGSSRRAPYPFNWQPTATGSYVLTATATDNLGHQRSSQPVFINVEYPGPSNDNFANRTRLQGTWLSMTNSNLGATLQPGEPNIAGNYGVSWANSIWWTWTAPASGIVTLSSADGDAFGVYTGTALTDLVNITNEFAPITFEAAVGTTYAIGAVGPDGEVTLELSLSNLKFVSPADGATFTNGSSLSLQAKATATEEPVRQVEFFANGNSVGVVTNAPYSFDWTNVPGANYSLAAVATDNLGHERSSPRVNTSLHPANDNFTNRILLQGDWILVTNATANATYEPGEPSDDQVSGAGSIWWQWIAPTSGWVTVDQPDGFGYIGVYTGDSVSTLETVAGAYSSTVGFAAAAGTTYDIAVSTSYDPATLQLIESGLSLSNLNNGEVVPAGTNLLLSAGNSDSGESFTQSEFFDNGGNPLAIVTNPPYNFVWTNVPPGIYSITVVGTDGHGRTFPSEGVSISVTPGNDAFANRTELMGVPWVTNGTTVNAGFEPGEPDLNGSGEDRTVWYSWTAPISRDVQVATVTDGQLVSEPSGFSVGVYIGSVLTNLAEVSYGPASAEFFAVAGTTYQIQVDGIYGIDSGVSPDFTLELGAPTTNASFADATPVTGTNVVMDGDNSFDPTNSLWYSWSAPGKGFATVSFSAEGYFNCQVYTSTDSSNLVEVAYLYFDAWITSNTFAAFPGKTYWIEVFNGPGAFSLDLSLVTVPGNDLFANRTPLSGMSLVAMGTTLYATSEPGEPNPFGDEDLSVWYAWTAPATGFVRIQSPDAFLAIFTGNVVSNLTAVATGGFENEVDFDAVAGQTYPIAVIQEYPYDPDTFAWSLDVSKVAITNPVAGATFTAGTNVAVGASTIDLDGAVTTVAFYANTHWLGVVTNPPFSIILTNFTEGDYVLSAQATDVNGGITTSKNVDVRVPPGNDNFASRIIFTGTNFTMTGDNSGATTELGEYLPGGASGRTIWWSWTAPTNGIVTLNAPSLTGYLSHPTRGRHITSNAVPKDVTGIITSPPGLNYAPLVAVYAGATLTNLSFYASNTVYYYDTWQAESPATFFVDSGQTYQISLDGLNGSFGDTTVNFSFEPVQPPPNDNFAQRTKLVGANIMTNGTTVGASLELTDPDLGDGLDARTVWYSWIAPASGTVEVQTFSYWWLSPYPPEFGVYAGSPPGSLIPVAASGDFNISIGSFYALAGTSYQIEVATPSETEEAFILYLNAPTAPMMYPANAVKLRNGTYDIHIIGSVGDSFVIQYSANLLTWTTIDTDTLESTSFGYIDTTPRTGSTRYYRVLPLDTVLNNQPFRMRTPPTQPANGFSISLTGESGLPFLIQSSTNLVDWFNLTSGVLIENGFNFTDYNAPNVPIQFYRSIQQ